MRTVGLAFALAFSSCGGEPEPSHPPADPPGDPREPSAPAESTVPVATTATASPPSTPSEPPHCVVRGEPGVDGIAISVEDHGESDVSLRTAVIVETQAPAGAFEPGASEGSLALRPDCEHAAETCVTLAPGGELRPPSWNGTWGDMQCDCERCAPADPGTYRFVVVTCDGEHRIEGAPFVLPTR